MKTKIISKIYIIYDSKLKANVIGREIRRKTQILTQDSSQNDPIDRWIKGFSFRDFGDDCRYLRSDFFLFSPQNLTFKHSSNAEINLEDEESKRFKD